MAKFYVEAPNLSDSRRGEIEDLVFDRRADAEHHIERMAAEWAQQFRIVTDDSEDRAKYAAEVQKERKAKLDRERQRKEQEEFAKARQ